MHSWQWKCIACEQMHHTWAGACHKGECKFSEITFLAIDAVASILSRVTGVTDVLPSWCAALGWFGLLHPLLTVKKKFPIVTQKKSGTVDHCWVCHVACMSLPNAPRKQTQQQQGGLMFGTPCHSFNSIMICNPRVKPTTLRTYTRARP